MGRGVAAGRPGAGRFLCSPHLASGAPGLARPCPSPPLRLLLLLLNHFHPLLPLVPSSWRVTGRGSSSNRRAGYWQAAAPAWLRCWVPARCVLRVCVCGVCEGREEAAPGRCAPQPPAPLLPLPAAAAMPLSRR